MSTERLHTVAAPNRATCELRNGLLVRAVNVPIHEYPLRVVCVPLGSGMLSPPLVVRATATVEGEPVPGSLVWEDAGIVFHPEDSPIVELWLAHAKAMKMSKTKQRKRTTS